MAVISSDQITLVNVSDAYSVTLSRESYIFIGNADGVPAGKKCTTEVTAYRGKNQCSAITIAEKQIICPTGISATVSGNGTSKVTVTFTTTATITPPCEATIPITVEGNSFTKQFTFSWIQDPEELESRLSKAETSISNNADAIKLKASQDEVTKLSDDYKLYTKNTTEFIQTAKGWQLNWEKLISTDDADVENHQDYITFVNGDIILGESSSDLKVKIANDSIQFKGTSDTEVTPDSDATAWITGKTFHISDGEIQNSLKFGKVYMKPDSANNALVIRDPDNAYDVAKFGSTVIIGKPSGRNVAIDDSGLTIFNDGYTIAKIAYGEALDSNSNVSKAGYVSMGLRKSGGTIGAGSYAEGWYTTSSGYGSHAEGHYTKALYAYSHAEGDGTTASGFCSHAEGNVATASGYCSHAECEVTTASGKNSHAEGCHATASGENSHAESYYTTASGKNSHAEGYHTTASGENSHAEGYYTTASGKNQTVIGIYNIEDANSTYAFMIGNGTYNKRSNALTVDWDGNITGKSLTSANDLNLGFKNGNAFKPYFTKGDTTTFTAYLQGRIITSGKEITFYMPFSRPIIGATGVSVSSVNGIAVSQNGKSLYGSSSYVKPNAYSASIIGNGHGVNIRATMPNTTNATNNATCAITASIKITFS